MYHSHTQVFDHWAKTNDVYFKPFINSWIGLGVCLFSYELIFGLSSGVIWLLLIGTGLLVRYLLHIHQLRAARLSFAYLSCTTALLLPVSVNGLQAPTLAFLPITVILSGWLLGRRRMTIIAVMLAVSIVAYALILAAGIWAQPSSLRSLTDDAIAWISAIAFAAVVCWFTLEAFEVSHQREAQLQRENQETFSQLKVLLALMQDAILLIDEHGRVGYANGNFCKHFSISLPPESLIGMTAQELLKMIYPAYADPESQMARIREVVAKGIPTIGDEVSMSSGLTLLRDFIPFSTPDGGTARIWSHRDVTQMHKAKAQLETFSYLDGLTQIPNRRKFDEVLPKEMLRCARTEQFLSLLMIDIDYFKGFNDSYGHLAGDDCLIQVAKAMQRVVSRPFDLLGRYGGEEFYVVLPDTDENGAVEVANRIKREVMDLKIEHLDSRPLKYVTVSIGVATVKPTHNMRITDLVCAADTALYQAKANGRNFIRACHPDSASRTGENTHLN